MARPKSKDPRIQRNVYPPTTLWERVAERAKGEKMRIADLFVTLAAEGLAAREAKESVSAELAARDA